MGEINRPSEQAARGSCLEPLDGQTELAQGIAQGRNRIAHPPASRLLQADVEKSAHEGSGGHYHRPRPVTQTEVCFDADDRIVLDQNPHRIALQKMEVGGVFQDPFEPELVSFLVALGPGGLHARTFARIEHTKLDPRRVRVLTHHTSERIDLPDHVSFG